MYERHPSFRTPDDLGTMIWRYMSVTKLLSLLHSRKLFFPRSDRLGDPFEGSFPKANEAQERALLNEIGVSVPQIDKMVEHNRQLSKNFRRFVAISCWHMNNFESAALWALYGPAGETVAVRSTVGRIIEALVEFGERVYIGAVAYLDYDREVVPAGNAFNPFLFKRRSFEHDRELRAIVSRWPTLAPDETYDPEKFWAKETIRDGIPVPVLLDKLIERVFISPTAPDWVHASVAAAAKAFGLKEELCIRSRLGEDPFA